MSTIFLKFVDEAEARTVLAQYIKEDEWMLASHDHALDVVGIIHKPTGEFTEVEGMQVPVMAPLDGFHVNYIGNEDFSAYAVTPSTPARVFA